MPAFNTVIASVEAACPNCGLVARRVVQFTYGDVWQHAYAVGDRLRWGANDEGRPGRAKVAVAGYGEDCVRCGADDPVELYDILLEDDVIRSVRPADGTVKYGPDDWVVLE